MARSTRLALIALGAVVLLVVIAAVSLPLFLNADSFRTRIEATLTKSLGRQVTIGKLELSVWSGGMVAEKATVADDPQYSNQPFIQADSVKINVKLLPLIISRQVEIRGFSLVSPKINLLRSANGRWNYSTIGGAASKQDEDTKKTFPDLTVGHVEVSDGRITVGSAPGVTGAASVPSRTYEQVALDVTDFSFSKQFKFTASTNLPASGTVSLKGTAGPINQQDASATPFSGNLEMKHIDPLAAGFVTPADGISGMVDSLVLDANWNGQQMHVSKLIVDTPNLKIVRTATPKAVPVKTADTNAEGSTMLDNLSVDDAEIKNGTLALSTAGQTTPPAVYQQVNARITNLTPKSYSPFTVAAQLPGGGSLVANGTGGPFNQQNTAATPLNAKITLKGVQLATAGVLPPDAGISGVLDLDAQVQSNGTVLSAKGTSNIANAKLAKDGAPSSKPVQVQFNLTQNEQAMTGQIQQAVITIGRVAVNIAGTYQTSGPTTALDLKVNGNAMSIDELQAFLPALGVHLPQGSRLNGGTLTTTLAVTGSTGTPIISGPVRIDNTQLAGFDLGAKLQTLSTLTGGKIGGATGSGTNIRSLSMNIREAGGAIQTSNIALDVVGVGTATGAGAVSAGGALNYNMVLKLTGLVGGGSKSAAAPATGNAALIGGLTGLIGGSGGAGAVAGLGGLTGGLLKNGIPVAIGGTTSNPTFAPNLKGLLGGAGGAAQGLVKGKGIGIPSTPGKNPLGNALGGLLGH